VVRVGLLFHAEDEAAAEAGEALELADAGSLVPEQTNDLSLAWAVQLLKLARVGSAREVGQKFSDLRIGQAVKRLFVIDVHDFDVCGWRLANQLA